MEKDMEPKENPQENYSNSAGRNSADRGPYTGKSAGTTPQKRFMVRRRKVCKFCQDKTDYIDYKDVRLLQQFIPERGKILPRRLSGTCQRHQIMLAEAIKRARHIAFIPYTMD
jgi:small subunit ribosomal protein S18